MSVWAVAAALIAVVISIAAVGVERERVARNNLIVTKAAVKSLRRERWYVLWRAFQMLVIVAIVLGIAYLVSTGPAEPPAP